MSALETNRQLPDGTRLLVREIRPEDRDLLALGFTRFGAESRYRRFLAFKTELTEADLEYLTRVDGVDHFAIGALTYDASGAPQPVGIARYVRLAPGSDTAEAAVAVVDQMQGKGVGKLLLRELSDAAYARGVRRFRCSLLTSNDAMCKVIQELDPNTRPLHTEAGVRDLELEVPAPQPPAEAPRKRLETVLRLVAGSRISWVPRSGPRASRRD